MTDSVLGIPVISIAAMDAPDWAKEEADIICTGVDDHAAFAWALEKLSKRGGGIIRPYGTFDLSGGSKDA